MAEQNRVSYGKILKQWQVSEYHQHERSKRWYIIAIVTTLLLLMFSLLTANFWFAVIIILASLIIILHDGDNPRKVRFVISDQGLIIGKSFYDYDDIKDFAVVYKPRIGVKSIYFEFKSALKQRLSISLENENPLPIREILLKFLKEDLERNEAPLSEQLANLFKL